MKDDNYMNMCSDVKRSWNGGYPVDITPAIAQRWKDVSVGKIPAILLNLS